MTLPIGVGGATIEDELTRLRALSFPFTPITAEEYQTRRERLVAQMKANQVGAVYLNAGTNLYYFTGLKWYASERLVGALLTVEGELVYVAPHFEAGSIADFWLEPGPIALWHEHESPYALVGSELAKRGLSDTPLAVDGSAAFFLADGLRQANPGLTLINADPMLTACRGCKSPAEIALMQTAKAMTLEVHKSAARILKAGISTTEVTAFINEAHKAIGAPGGSSFCIVLFGVATSFPHGVKEPQILKANDWVLIDTGCLVEGYNSDITRSYCFGQASDAQRHAWEAEKAAQLAAFNAAQPGEPCEAADYAARAELERFGFGPDYQLPGLPHRTGHGCGLDIHEGPYLVRGDATPLATGMVFSNEPMLVIPGQFGVRLEDHFYVGKNGPVWFTEPSHSLDDPFGLNA
ncbi:M24 family metallopeptidase [Ferrimonas balearica]|uniref:M24 family metallopeptidase n=1 Tax=Ferrimonas balearica TaxID=44012 RepID=UPI001C99AA7A|nr:Xaa-Pro peptidase family protein [Ferrimonas balearica]MBY5919997.1 Xaa-Pro peptidase family protein [Ferrimonas balearica]MBY5997318.1 Xaa-Pro peptidase family protein [Ferrimonas balearica]